MGKVTGSSGNGDKSVRMVNSKGLLCLHSATTINNNLVAKEEKDQHPMKELIWEPKQAMSRWGKKTDIGKTDGKRASNAIENS